jgi:hypothetical protein
VEWIADVLADPRKFITEYESYRANSVPFVSRMQEPKQFRVESAAKRSIMAISVLIRSLIDFSVFDTKPYMTQIAEKFHKAIADKFEESLSALIEVRPSLL